MKSHRISLVAGVALLIFAWLSAGSIPKRADAEFLKQWEGANDPSFVASHIQIIAESMQLRTFYVAAAGLVCLGCGIVSATKKQPPLE